MHLTPAEQALLTRFDTAPYTSQPGAIPFIDVANRYIQVGAGYSPLALAGLSQTAIAGQLAAARTPLAQAVDGVGRRPGPAHLLGDRRRPDGLSGLSIGRPAGPAASPGAAGPVRGGPVRRRKYADPVTANRLGAETSPYLRQHADNPVDWYPWGDEAFARARDEDKPLFVSIGYASCHWCHVMAHETFEDPEVGGRSWPTRSSRSRSTGRSAPTSTPSTWRPSRPMTGSGGWPMSVFCTPDGRPFFAGTYFPPADRHGSPAFRRVLAALADAWATRRPEVEEQADALADAVRQEVRLADELADRVGGRGVVPGFDAAARRRGGRAVDPVRRRAGAASAPAPKFPRPAMVELCLLAPRPDRRPAVARAWPPPPSTPWPPAASTTTWPAASPATRPTPSGWSPTSRRC